MWRLPILLLAVLLLAACAPWQPAEDSSGSSTRARPGAHKIETPPAWYQVQRGDSLYSIAFRFGLDWRELAAWNKIGPPHTIRPGQELRTYAPPQLPPSAHGGTTAETTGSAPAPDRSSPPASSPAASSPSSTGNRSTASTPAANPPATRQPAARPPATRPAEPPVTDRPASGASGNTRNAGGIVWQWPTRGRVVRQFDAGSTRKGIGIAGRQGQEVVAAASGEVVYSGNALIAYGELVIIKHSDSFFSAYGHNHRRLVEEGQRVERGQKIAELGRDDRRQELLHFEVRRSGSPVNPLDYLPAQ